MITSPVDMGNGRSLAPEDLLEGHFARLARQAASTQPSAQHTVNVHVNPNLQAAITVLAPDLAPLTELAEEVAQVVPCNQPATRFRQDLHRALEQTHRQQSAQRKLGTRVASHADTPWGLIISLALAVMVVMGGLAYWRLQRRMAAA
jgi:hypothetical protein